ncbi:MAG: AmmeMemoRadiSam system protein B [Deltaproteobacteria bacterium]|nr:AmmeMemoRadiSam system protein B [Deltaproteobacteria bacterium]
MSRILRFRPFLSFFPVNWNNETYVAIQCNLNLLQQPVIFHSAIKEVLTLLIYGIKENEFKRILGTKLSVDEINKFIRMLDDNLLLESELWTSKFQNIKQTYFQAGLREPCLEGKLFPAKSDQRRALIKGWLSTSPSTDEIDNPDLIILPHIDYQRGWQIYANTIKSIKGLSRKRFAILIGTDHKPTTRLLSVSNKDYFIDGFRLPVWKDALVELNQKLGDWIFDDLINQKSEHSLEICLPFLETIWHDELLILPITVGGIDHLTKFEDLTSHSEFESFSSVLSEFLSDKIRDTVFILCIDFSHLGKTFGDPFEITDSLSEATRSFDNKLKEDFHFRSTKPLFEENVTLNLKQKVCGFSSLTLTRRIFDNLGLRLNSCSEFYRQAVTQNRECFVSFWGITSTVTS